MNTNPMRDVVVSANPRGASRRKRGEARIWLRGRIWWIQYYVNGIQQRESSDSEKQEDAERLAPLEPGRTSRRRRSFASRILSLRFSDFAGFAPRVLFTASPLFLVLAAWVPMGDTTKSDSRKAS